MALQGNVQGDGCVVVVGVLFVRSRVTHSSCMRVSLRLGTMGCFSDEYVCWTSEQEGLCVLEIYCVCASGCLDTLARKKMHAFFVQEEKMLATQTQKDSD